MSAQRRLTRISCSFIPALLIVLFLGSAAAVRAADVSVEVGDNFFNAASITVNVGDTVTWNHRGQRPHDVTADDGTFSSPRRMMNGQTFTFTATTPGNYAYVCTIHQGMNGTLVVQAAQQPAAPPRTGGGGLAGGAATSWSLVLGLGLLLAVGAATARGTRRRAA